MTSFETLYEAAMENGSVVLNLWFFNSREQFAIVLVHGDDDKAHWYFRDTAEHVITEADARNLVDVYEIGYLNF